MSTSRSLYRSSLSAAFLLIVAAGPVHAGLTLVSNGDSLTSLLYNQYGGGRGGFSGTVNTAFSYANGVTLTRVQDFSGAQNFAAGTASLPAAIAGTLGLLDPYSGNQDDQTWAGGIAAVIYARYRSAAHAQDFGYSDGAVGYPTQKSFTHILDLLDGVNTPGAPMTVTLPAAFRWARNDNSSSSHKLAGAGWENSSLNSDNLDGRDHMVTFFINDPAGRVLPAGVTRAWVVGFEDLSAQDRPDYDYNDSIIQVSAAPAEFVPEPCSLALLAVGGLGVLRRRRPMGSSGM